MPLPNEIVDVLTFARWLALWLAGGPAGNFLEINDRDKVTLGVMIERLRRKGGLQRKHFEAL